MEGIYFFTQLAGARGSGISVVSDSDFYDRVRSIVIPWYSPAHQRTQFSIMKEVADHKTRAFDHIPMDEVIDIREWAIRYSLEISGRGACSYDFKILDPDAEKSEFAKAVPECLKEGVTRVAEA